MELLKDKYRKTRGGHSRLLKISCAKCGKVLFNYQKDGPGILKRLYLDRINPGAGFVFKLDSLICLKCKTLLGIKIIYKKENRPAIRLFVGAIEKKISKT